MERGTAQVKAKMQGGSGRTLSQVKGGDGEMEEEGAKEKKEEHKEYKAMAIQVTGTSK